ncbi:MAG: nuclear transport factor 2 family protein [Gammaproteobacteria bacterium]|nr:nuclear transport factor 2 family protein [Gammaproteobacteria bacterium]
MLALLGGALTGCAGPGVGSAELIASYEQALVASEAQAVADLDQDPERLAAFVARAEAYFRDITQESVRDLTRETYAPDGYLNDTLKVITGAEAIEEYFYETAGNTDAVRVEFLSYAATGMDVYVRWRMTIEAPRLADEPLVSYGVSQFRFDEQGRLLIHKDFWDSGGNFFEHLPFVGRAIRSIRGRL